MMCKKLMLGLACAAAATSFGEVKVQVDGVKGGDDGTSFELRFDAMALLSGASRTMYAVFGAADCGPTTNGWEHVENLGPVAVDATTGVFRVSSCLSGQTPCLRFVLLPETTFTSESYRQDDLFAQWDGEDNALDENGQRVHLASTTTWTDLTGNGWDGTCTKSEDRWADKCCHFTHDSAEAFALPQNFQKALGTSWTIEACAMPKEGNTVNYAGICGGHGGAHGISFCQFESPVYKLGTWAQWGSDWASAAYSPDLLAIGACHHIVLAVDGETKKMFQYIDGVLQNELTMGSTVVDFPDFWLGRANGNGDRTFVGDIYAIRAYTNALSAADVKQHFMVDSARFASLAFGQASALLSYSRTLGVEIVRPNTSEGGDIVSFDLKLLGDYAESGDLYAAYGTADGGLYTNGWQFVECVQADVAADVKVLTVAAPAGFGGKNGCIRFFRVAQGGPMPFSYDYVTDELAAQWDAADNAVDGVSGTRGYLSETTKWIDLSGNGWNATSAKGTLWTDNSYRFNRSDNCSFTVSPDNLLASLGTSWTVEAYVKPDSNNANNYAGICGGHYTGAGGFICGQHEDGRYWFGDSAGFGIYIPAADIAANASHHVCFTMDAAMSKAILYLDGVQVWSGDKQGGEQLSFPTFWIGKAWQQEGQRNFSGDIYGVRVYKKALSTQEVAQNRQIDRLREGSLTVWPVSGLFRQSEIVNLEVVIAGPHGAVDPDVGRHDDLAGDLPLTCTSSQFVTNSATLYECLASVLTKAGEQTSVTNTALSLEFNPTGSGTWTLEWLWGVAGYSVLVSQSLPAAVAHTEVLGADYHDFFTPGATATVRAVSDDPRVAFDHWTGDVPAESARMATVEIAMDRVKSVHAVFVPQYWLYGAEAAALSDGPNIFNVTALGGGKLRVERIRDYCLGYPDIDFSLPVRDADGAAYTLTEIGENALGWTGVTSVKLPDTVEVIGKQAFYNCTSLTSVEPLLPDSVRYVGAQAFTYDPITNNVCIGRTRSVELGVTPERTAPSGFDGSQFSCCDLLGDIYLGAGVTNVPSSCFFAMGAGGALKRIEIVGAKALEYQAFRNRNAEEVLLPNNIEVIGDFAFGSCGRLTKVTPFLPDTVRSIGVQAFWNTAVAGDLKLLSRRPVTLDAVGSQLSMVTGVTSMEFGRGVTNIPGWFDCCNGAYALTNVTCYGELQTIGKEAFRLQLGLLDFRLNGYPTMDPNAFAISDYQIRFAVPIGNAQWDAYFADRSKVLPWDEVDPTLQAKFFARFGAEAKPPVGLTLVTDRLPVNQWVVRWKPLPLGTMILVR